MFPAFTWKHHFSATFTVNVWTHQHIWMFCVRLLSETSENHFCFALWTLFICALHSDIQEKNNGDLGKSFNFKVSSVRWNFSRLTFTPSTHSLVLLELMKLNITSSAMTRARTYNRCFPWKLLKTERQRRAGSSFVLSEKNTALFTHNASFGLGLCTLNRVSHVKAQINNQE